MQGNGWGKIFRLTSFGESHGAGIGGVIEGCPPGLEIDLDFVQAELARRKPGQSRITTPRKEDDAIEFLSGIHQGRSLGTPIGFLIRNQDQKSKDYDHIKDVYRPSHADFTYDQKYGLRDHRGGGRSSARETAARVAAGAIAKLALARLGVKVWAYVSQVGTLALDKPYAELDPALVESNIVRCPEPETAERMIRLIEQARAKGDTLGGIITGVATGVPAGLGEPVFDKLHADLGKAMLSINAVKGFEYGSGFAGSSLFGSEHNDAFVMGPDGRVGTATNHSGGIQGGISNGQDIYFRVAFKPIATLMRKQESLGPDGLPTTILPKGRHDPCVLPRAVPIVEAMAAMTLLDHYLMNLARF